MPDIDEDLLLVLDMYIGDIVTKIVKKNNYPIILEDEYYDLLMFIYEELCRIWFKGSKPELKKLREGLQKAREKRSQLEILISYLISKYLEESDTLYITQ